MLKKNKINKRLLHKYIHSLQLNMTYLSFRVNISSTITFAIMIQYCTRVCSKVNNCVWVYRQSQQGVIIITSVCSQWRCVFSNLRSVEEKSPCRRTTSRCALRAPLIRLSSLPSRADYSANITLRHMPAHTAHHAATPEESKISQCRHVCRLGEDPTVRETN